MGLVFRHPEPGERVGDYRILEKIGAGGFGTVFKAERAGLFFAVKILRSHELGARERREIGILLNLENPRVVRFRACDRWLDPKSGPPYIVTDFVPGPTLEAFAEVENPSARKSARLMLETARTLGDVHRQGVFHRDLKPENIIIQGRNERPVLIDFGVGSYAGARVITPFGVPPGTYEYRSPEANLFNRANTELAHYEFTATDEQWALGVTFYWLLTNVLPFGDRYDPEGGGLTERIIHMRPLAPHQLNPRVPSALSGICMRMLEKKPEERYASVVELCATLGGAMAEAKENASWDLPLFDPDAPDPQEDANDDEVTRMMRKWAKAQPRRGRKPEKVTEPSEVLQVPAPAETPRVPAAPPAPVVRRRPRFAVAAGLATAVLGALLLTRTLSPPGSEQLSTSSKASPTQQAGIGREIAPTAKPLDPPNGEGAEPTTGSLSAPEMLTMLREDDTTRKPQAKKTTLSGPAAKAIGTGLVCNLLTGCPAAAPQIRPTPEPAPCPAGAVETMEMLGIRDQNLASFHLKMNRGMSFISVREGETTLSLVSDWGKLPDRTLLSGRLIFGGRRVYGRLTEAKVQGGGTFKVCLEVWDLEGGRGAIREPDGGEESARIFSTVNVTTVRSFE